MYLNRNMTDHVCIITENNLCARQDDSKKKLEMELIGKCYCLQPQMRIYNNLYEQGIFPIKDYIEYDANINSYNNFKIVWLNQIKKTNISRSKIKIVKEIWNPLDIFLSQSNNKSILQKYYTQWTLSSISRRTNYINLVISIRSFQSR